MQSNDQAGGPQLAALFQITPEALAQLLQLPEGAHLDYVQARIDQPGVLQARVRGAGWPTEPGSRVRGTKPTIYRSQCGCGVVHVNLRWEFEGPENNGGEARLAAHQPLHTTTATPQGVASTDQLGRVSEARKR